MKRKYIVVPLVVVILSLMLFSVSAFAAQTLTSPYTNLSASTDGSNVTSSSATAGSGSNGGTVSMTVTGSTFLSKDGTITLTNSGTVAAKLSFSYAVSATGYSSFTVAGNTASSSGGSYSAELAAGASVKIYLKCPKKVGITVSLSNVKLEVASSADIQINYNSLGTVAVNGTKVASGSTVTVSATGAPFKATPNSGAIFVGWVNTANYSVVSTSDNFNYVPTGNASVTAVFTTAESEAWFLTNGKSYLVQGLGTAITATSSAAGKTIVLAASGSLSSGNYIIPSGVTLLLPFDSNSTCYTTSPGYVEDSWKEPSAFCTMTMVDGANIVVSGGGAISVSAKVSAKMGYAGAPTSSYGHIAMQSGSSITVNSEGNLYAWGYISGSGSVTIKSGATVYESFQVVDWRGGTASSGMINNSNKVFPMSQYYVQNVEAPMTLEAGAAEKCSMVADIISVRQVVVPFVGSSGCMFNLTSGSVTKRYDGSADRILLDINGDLSVSNTTISLILMYNITVGNYVLPIGNNYSLNVNSGTLDFETSTSLLAGSELNIAEGAKVTVTNGAKLFVYDETEWKSGVYIYSAGTNYHRPVRYAVGKNCTRTAANIVDAKILVNGTLDASAGYLYTTASGANIYSTGNGVVILQAADDSHTLYEAVQTNTDISYSSIPIVSAKLKDEDGEYFETSAGTYKFAHYTCTVHGDTAENSTNAKCGAWHAGDPKEEVSGPDATCTENGSKTYTCSCAHSYTVTINALGHTPGAAATCTTGQLCTVCDAVLKAALGHNSVIDAAKAATCTETGLTEGCHCSVCNEVLVAQEVIAALGHAWNWGGWSSATNGQQCTCTCRNDASHTITVLLAYRMDSYIWLNATVSSTVGTPVCNEMTLQADKYLVQKVLSNHITDSVCVTFQVDEFGKTNKLEIGFLEYAKSLSADTNTTDETVELLASMLMYGEASEDYFGKGEELDGVAITGNDNGTILTAYQESLLNNTAIPERLTTALRACALSGHNADKNLLKPADTNANYGEKGLENGLTISTTGAAFYFDEALRLSVGYRFADGVTVNLDENGNPDGTITFDDTTYTVLQVGLLVQELKDWTMCDVLYAENDVTAYIAYDNSASLESGRVDEEGNQENHPDVGEGGPDPFVNTLGKSGEINFDLLVKEYKKGFALRTYAVLEANGTQYVIYGKQYGYGLEAYVKATYGVDTAFDPLLATAWGYAQAAAARYPEVK